MFNAYNISKLCGESRHACIFLLDSEIPTLFHEKLPEPVGHISIFARGGELKKPDGEHVHDPGSFTNRLTDTIWDWAEFSTVQGDKTIFGGKGLKELRTMPQLLTTSTPRLTYKINRVDALFSQHVHSTTMNIVVDPEDIRKNEKKSTGLKIGKVNFFMYTTTKAKKAMPPPPAPVPISAPPNVVSPPARRFSLQTTAAWASQQASLLAKKRSADAMSTADEGYSGSIVSPALQPNKRR